MNPMNAQTANDIQVGGDHYRRDGRKFQHWDLMAKYHVGYFPAVITKYAERHQLKKGVEDLDKAIHYCLKWIEVGTLRYDSPINKDKARHLIRDAAEYASDIGLDVYQTRVLISALLGAKHDVLLTLEVYRDHFYGEYAGEDFESPTAEDFPPPGTPEDGGHHARQVVDE